MITQIILLLFSRKNHRSGRAPEWSGTIIATFDMSSLKLQKDQTYRRSWEYYYSYFAGSKTIQTNSLRNTNLFNIPTPARILSTVFHLQNACMHPPTAYVHLQTA